ncbi:MAG: nicotinate-nucleotide adenylyltransferase [Clostridia bacterium]|nr:nicotinate-nucleotide adenylyltransferase [Clostridia bacterium]
MLKVGIMGGTFNPIHEGHLIIARAAKRAAGLDEVVFLPSGQPPHKQNSLLAPATDRLNMTILAVYGEDGFVASDMEVMRQGTTYTVDTVRQILNERPGIELYYIIGGDTLFQVHSWRTPEQIAGLLNGGMIVVPRPGADREALISEAAVLQESIGLRTLIADDCGPDISSTEIRNRLKKGEPVNSLLPQAVADYITQHGLYQAPYSQMTEMLRRTLSEYRLRHTLSVAETAVWLAHLYGVDPHQAHLAGMLHDCAKGMDAPTLLQLIRNGGVSADDLELSMPALLHAPAGAALARSQYHISDQNVLSAIRWHTTGRRNMTALEKVVYLADMIEPGRTPYKGLDELRQCARRNLDEAVYMAAALSASYVAGRGKKLHPRTMELAARENSHKNRNGGQ